MLILKSRRSRLTEPNKGRSSSRLMAIFSLAIGLGLANALPAHTEQQGWKPVSGEDELRLLVSGARVSGRLTDKATWVAEYCADGTGVQWAWGERFRRTWTVEGEDQICILAENEKTSSCYTFERSTTDPTLYRSRDSVTDRVWEFVVSHRRATSCQVATAAVQPPQVPGAQGTNVQGGGPGAAEMAKKLVNPTAALAKVNSHIDFTEFGGDLPDADNQRGWRYTLQPTLPFPQANGMNILFRPAIPLLFKQPVFDQTTGQFTDAFELGDIGFDLAYGGTNKNTGLILMGGLVGSIPTATSDAVGSDQWAFGPEALVGLSKKWGVVGLLVSQRWKVAGNTERDTNVTGGQYFYAFPFGDGSWQISGAPAFSYNHTRDGERWTLPLAIGLGKTAKMNGKIIRFSFEYRYYVKSPDAFGPKHAIRLTFTPVVKAPWSK